MSWYDTLAALAMWSNSHDTPYNDGDMIYNGQVIHRDQFDWDFMSGNVDDPEILSYRYFLFSDEDCENHGLKLWS